MAGVVEVANSRREWLEVYLGYLGLSELEVLTEFEVELTVEDYLGLPGLGVLTLQVCLGCSELPAFEVLIDLVSTTYPTKTACTGSEAVVVDDCQVC